MKRDTILIVDDMEINRAILRTLFEQEYNLLEAENGEQAVLLIKEYRDSLAAVLLDLVMPIKDGYQVMAELTQNGLMLHFPVIVITSEDSMENEVRAFDLGASDIIIKPFEPRVVRRRVWNAVELYRHKLHLEEMVEEQAAKLRESRDVIMDTLSSVIEHRSAETGQHVLRIRMFTKVLLEDVMRCCPEYDLTERTIGVIAEAAALHDIGKISIPDTILNKPGPLTDEEFETMKTHTVKGCEILSGLDRMGDPEYLRYAYNICRYHHERWDGRGYPEGLKGDNTPICAQAVGVADAYDALTTDRVYKKALPPERAMTMILNGECGLFSPKLLECLKNVREQFYELARSYADAQSPQSLAARAPSRPERRETGLKSVSELGQQKYFALLRYLGFTVLEVDMDSGVYHLVHQQNEDFEELRSGGTFDESLRAFAAHAVHPDDRATVLGILDGGVEKFFGSGLIKRSREYRVFHRASGEYVLYEGTALRVDIDNPQRHRVLFVWRPIDPAVGAQTAHRETVGVPTTNSLPVGVRQCLNDQWLTLTYCNEGFITLFGYSRQEIATQFHSHYVELLHPDDRMQVRRRLLEAADHSGTQELEYRIMTKQGKTVWVLDQSQLVMGKDGCEYLHCVLTDITQIKQAQEELRLSMERYQIILDQTNDIIFEWNIEQDHIKFSPNWEKLFGYRPIDSGRQMQTASHIFPADMPAFQTLMAEVTAGVPYNEIELRIADGTSRYRWCRLRATTQFDDAGRPVGAVGVVLDIDTEKRRTQELIHKAEQDALTGLYTKNTAGEMIRRALTARGDTHGFAMLIIDLDNFKQINDLHGHMFGDAVLSEAASRLKALFRAGDVVARFGGDEFLVFLPYASGRDFLNQKATAIIDAFRGVYPEELQACALTCSIGIALCPEDGVDFQTLFQHSDRALYQAKQRGKDQFAFYDGATMSKIFGVDSRQACVASTRIESDDGGNFSVDSLVPQAFQLLYASGNVETAVNAILEMVGQKYAVSRAYIFEDSEDGSWSKNTFEWCNTDICPEIDALQHVLYADLGKNYRDNFNENGIFYCRDISTLPKEQYQLLAPQGVRSLLQCAVRDNGRFAGFVGFDDCTSERLWTQSQIDALIFISELLSTFLLKKRAQDRALTAVSDLHTVLDNQNSWLYVIDPESYKLRYINAKTRATVPGVRLGARCYEVFFHRNSPCERCPACGIQEKHSQTLEIYNPVLGIWSLADASLIRWGDREACLLACHDITGYMTGEKTPAADPQEQNT